MELPSFGVCQLLSRHGNESSRSFFNTVETFAQATDLIRSAPDGETHTSCQIVEKTFFKDTHCVKASSRCKYRVIAVFPKY